MPSKQTTTRYQAKAQGKKSRQEQLAKARAARASQPLASSEPSASSSAQPSPSSAQPSPSSSAGNDHGIAARESASKRKLSFFDAPKDQPNLASAIPTSLPVAIVDLNVIAGLFACFTCELCRQPLSLTIGNHKSFVHSLSVLCTHCQHDSDEYRPPATAYTSSRMADGKTFELNRRIIAAFLNIGIGEAGIKNFCETLGMEGPSGPTYHQHVNAIHGATEPAKSRILDSAVEVVKKTHDMSADDSVLDISVQFDGSWHKRGHTSKHGLAAVVEVSTGLVVDYHIMSTFCHQCSTVGAAKKKLGEEYYETWFATHEPHCSINHTGSAGLMEVEAARTMWQRSQKRGLRYTTMVSDGDCKTHNELQKLQPYSVPVIKEECTNHVSKRLGTALRNLVSSESAKGNTLGGRKAGSLTQAKINLLQRYYKSAVASKCQSVEELRQRIWRAFHHASSTDENPQHHNCPQGESSSCFFNKALAQGIEPPSHTGPHQSSIYLAPAIAKYVRPIYQRLTSDELLERCLQGLTQNPNESLHASVWAKCPKHLFVGRKRIEIAATLAIGQFNAGSRSLQHFLTTIGCQLSHVTSDKGARRDRKRVSQAEKKESKETKRRRTLIANANAAAQAELRRQEGQVYSAGAF